MELAVDAAQSRQLPEFLERFAGRAARMLERGLGRGGCFSREGNGLVFGGSERNCNERGAKELDHLAARESRVATAIRPLPAGEAAVRAGGAAAMSAVFVSIVASDGERLGMLCLLRQRKNLDTQEKKLLHALASHAALSLENFRRFSQLEKSKRQWVEDIDAISDYIVVHDRAWKIVRTNRSLASHLGVPPVALVGEAMSGLRQIAETGSDLPCPFCRDTQRAREEYVAASADRIFLVSTSRAPGVVKDDTRTIHVLKDITDRREAERSYRELFDSIQEGLFFATPDGRFLDVNDAMVRMLGYDSREELLQGGREPASLSHCRRLTNGFLQATAERGVLRNYEETLRRKDGALLHTLQNITRRARYARTHCANSRTDAGRYGTKVFSIAIAAGAGLQPKDPEYHAKHDFGAGYGGADQLRQPAVLRSGLPGRRIDRASAGRLGRTFAPRGFRGGAGDDGEWATGGEPGVAGKTQRRLDGAFFDQFEPDAR